MGVVAGLVGLWPERLHLLVYLGLIEELHKVKGSIILAEYELELLGDWHLRNFLGL
jgi:hypothetical protein